MNFFYFSLATNYFACYLTKKKNIAENEENIFLLFHAQERGIIPTWWHVIRRLLELDHLLIFECATVVNHEERVVHVAMCAQRGFRNPAFFDLHISLKLAHRTPRIVIIFH